MPEKTTESTNSHHTTTEKPTEKMEDTARRYMREAETRTRDNMNTYNDMIKTTTNYYYDYMDRTMRYSMEWGKYMTDAWEDMLTIYRRMYTDNYKTWNTYWDEVYKMVPTRR